MLQLIENIVVKDKAFYWIWKQKFSIFSNFLVDAFALFFCDYRWKHFIFPDVRSFDSVIKLLPGCKIERVTAELAAYRICARQLHAINFSTWHFAASDNLLLCYSSLLVIIFSSLLLWRLFSCRSLIDLCFHTKDRFSFLSELML